MDPKEIKRRILLGRSFVTKFGGEEGVDEDYATDQELKKPQPPETILSLKDLESQWRGIHITLHMKKPFLTEKGIFGKCHVPWEETFLKEMISVHSHFYFHCLVALSASKLETT